VASGSTPGHGSGEQSAGAADRAIPSDVPGRAPKPATRPDLLSSPDGLPPLISRIPVGNKKIVFLTIDDGWEQDPRFIDEVHKWNIPLTVFLMRDAVKGHWDYFKQLLGAGAHIQDHTVTHPDMRRLSLDGQHSQICDMADSMTAQFGYRPVLFRPPFGSFDAATREAAKQCGMKAVLLWRESVQLKGKIAYQDPGKRLAPGDIVLQHFRPGLGDDFPKVLKRVKDQGFLLGDLADYLPMK
jgi:peptidoglycan/xylan/chitin deacetylase (PgdA/CDA1 family)